MIKTSLFSGRGLLITSAFFAFLGLGLTVSPFASTAGQLRLHTNQQMIDELLQHSDLDISNPNAVFEAVFQELSEKVKVYPTESYYYFSFAHNGLIYAGNIRFDAFDQFDGKVHFAYFPEYGYWHRPQDPAYKKLGPDDGLEVKQVNKFTYKIIYKGKTVEFDIPDLSSVKPKPEILGADEVYLGPSWDESGVQFFLVYNKTAKTFLYLLNDTPKMDAYEKSDVSPALTVGNRTSFALYKDKLLDRQILIGVFAGNTELNNYFDGPFDQLPDNYIEGNSLRDILYSIDPSMKGHVDRYGSEPSGEVRYAITTYKYYSDISDLKPIVDCAAANNDPAKYYSCFNVSQDDADHADDGKKAGQIPEGGAAEAVSSSPKTP
jgi:hypothetical protein